MYPPFDADVYLELGAVMIHNDSFHYIGDTNWGNDRDPWMRDESLDMALETLRLDLKCDDHAIAIANSTVAQICLFAAESEDSCPRSTLNMSRASKTNAGSFSWSTMQSVDL